MTACFVPEPAGGCSGAIFRLGLLLSETTAVAVGIS